MTRVIAGTAGGLRLDVPRGRWVRPTADRVKEALFSSLGDLSGLVVLDLYAGSGGLGIEALSRGAARVVFVERDPAAVAVIRANLDRTGLVDRALVVAADAVRFCGLPDGGPFDLLLLDPPYDTGLDTVVDHVGSMISRDAVRAGARIVVERDRRRTEPVPRLLPHERDRTYGDTVLRFFRHVPTAPTTMESR